MPRPGNEWWIWESLVGIETALNHGALFGIGQGRSGLFSVLSVIAAAGIVYWLFAAKAARDWLLTIALSMITGGILGNLYDRLGLWGGQDSNGETIHAVRDWILIAYGGLNLPLLGEKWPNFNIADSLLVCGAGLLIWHAFTTNDASKTAPAARTGEAPPKSR
jgi:signal peptidase II